MNSNTLIILSYFILIGLAIAIITMLLGVERSIVGQTTTLILAVGGWFTIYRLCKKYPNIEI